VQIIRAKGLGGLIMLWNKDVHLKILNHNNRFIDFYIVCPITNFEWYATSFDGFSNHNEKLKSCDLINSIKASHQHDNWLIFGDFNMILHETEKMGGNPIDINIFDNFHNTINNCNLIDLGYMGDIFTWANNQPDTHYIQERIDKFLATPSWISNYPKFYNNHLLRYALDHNPILLEFFANNECRAPKRYHMPRFEQLWLQNEATPTLFKLLGILVKERLLTSSRTLSIIFIIGERKSLVIFLRKSQN